MKVTILRGISGSGKSTWVKQNAPEAVVASADHFFLQANGTYVFDAEKLSEAHISCFRTFLEAAQNRVPHIIIDNSNIFAWEISPYVIAGTALAYTVEVLTLECDPEIAIQRKSWVRPDKVRRMAEHLEREQRHFPPSIARIHRVISPA